MNNHLATLEQTTLAQPSAIPEGLQITHDVRLRQVQAEMLSRHQLAIMLPRDWIGVGRKLLAACEDPDFAKVAFYSKGAGREKIEGLSVRFVELAQRLMRNISIDTSPEMENATSVHYRMTVTDLESNTPTSETFRVDKTVERRSVDEGKLRAQMARIKRTLVLSLVPAEIRVQCLQRCKEIARKEDARDPQEATKSLVAAFLSLGIDVPDLKEYLGHSPSSLAPKEIEDLRGIYALIRDGEMIWSDVLEARRELQPRKGSKAGLVEKRKAERAKNKAPRAPRGSRQGAEAAAAGTGGAASQSKQGGGKGKAADTAKAEPPKARASRRGDEEEEKEEEYQGRAGGGSEPPPNSSPPSSS